MQNGNGPALFGFDPAAGATPEAGPLETATRSQIDTLRKLGYVEDNRAAQIELALVAARDIDRSTGKGAPSGRANLLRVMNEILESLPQPEAASQDALDLVVKAMMSDDPEEVPAVVHARPTA